MWKHSGPTSNRRSDVPDCALCRTPLQTPTLRETQFWRIALNRNQNQLGKAIIVLARHEEDVTLLTQDEWATLQAEVRWTVERLRSAFSADHYNYSFLQNLDRHVHLHVIPRYLGNRHFAGLEFSDPDYPDRFRRAAADENVVGEEVLAAIAAELAS